MRVIVCGGRNYADFEKVERCLNKFRAKHGVSLIIQGGANGADAIAMKWAENYGIPHCTMHANWSALGKKAGPRRNQEMLDLLTPDCVIAFPGGTGTADMVQRAKREGVKVWEVGK